MGESVAADDFTNALLKTIREQRHKNARVIISTQEPTISPKLLELCSITLVHRFRSPAWLQTLKKYLAGASAACGGEGPGSEQMMDEIVNLCVGEALLFAPEAMLDIVDGKSKPLAKEFRKFRTRSRVTADGGRSEMAS